MAGYGAAASPVLLDDQLIMTYDNQEESYIASFDVATGDVLWEQDRDEKSTWGTPFVWKHAGGTEIVQTGKKENRSYSPDGELLWHFDGKMSVLTIPSPFVVDDLLYITSGYFQRNERPVFAIKPGARGDITLDEGEASNEFISWSVQKMGPYNTTPIVYQDRYYTLLDRGMLTCHDAKTGELIFDRIRFPNGASFTASPWAYNGNVLFLSEDGRTFVITPGEEIKEIDGKKRLIVNQINDLDELSIATPSTVQGKLLLRTASKLYCISNQ
jgi:outer membrane protein assembly factor BamB